MFCDLTSKDLERLHPAFVRRHVLHVPLAGPALVTKERLIRTGPLKGCTATTCVALRGSLMHRVSCSIYENRPEVCRRAVKPGDRTCKDVRRMLEQLIEGMG